MTYGGSQGIRQRLRAMAPFIGMTALAFAVVPVTDGVNRYGIIAIAALLMTAVGALTLLVPWQRFPPFALVVPALAYLAALAVLRDGAGGPTSGYGALALLPVVWLALYGTQAALLVGLAGVAGTFVAPVFLIGGPEYPVAELRRALITVSVAAVAAFTVKRLVQQSKRLSAQLLELAHHDPLTGLPNRRAWNERLPGELARARRNRSALCVALIDIDHFKAFNDRHGHPAGDALLREAAEAWTAVLREVDLIARYGGEEFAMLLPGCTLDNAIGVLEAVHAATPGATCSAGVAEWNRVENGQALVQRADLALLTAKRQGRNRTVIDLPSARRLREPRAPMESAQRAARALRRPEPPDGGAPETE